MERYAIYIPAEGKCRLVPCNDGDTCKLKTLQELVGGFIEVTESSLEPTWAREPVDCIHLIVNEDGLLLSLPDNPRATDLYAYGDRSVIVGDALLMAGRGEDLIGFSKPVCQTIAEFWDLEMEDFKNGREGRFQTFNPD